MYAKSYVCNRCGKVSTKMSNNDRHQVKCDGKVKFSLPGGIYKNNPCLRIWRDSKMWVLAQATTF